MEPFSEGCLICGKELEYTQDSGSKECYYCSEIVDANVKCPEGHYVCDSCHASSAFDLIQLFCNKSESTNPIDMALHLMRSTSIKMHGPEHHYLVPAVLLSSYYNFHKDDVNKKNALLVARKRSEMVPGGFCGSHGNCGAAVGTGIFISIISGSTPLAEREWQLSNTMTGKTLLAVAEQGGPRCCKRDSFLSIHNTIDFLKEHFQTTLLKENVVCEFSARNKQCKFDDCIYYHAD